MGFTFCCVVLSLLVVLSSRMFEWGHICDSLELSLISVLLKL